jgi:histidinol-phosphate phosphatase family protein
MNFAARRRYDEAHVCWPPRDRIRAVLLDLDGTLIFDNPHRGNPDLVCPLPGVVESVARLRSRGLAIGLVTNQPGVARGSITLDDVYAVNARVAELVGPFHTVAICTHELNDRCRCRKPAPGMIRATARALRIPTRQCVVVGSSGVDIGAARLAGAAAIMLSSGELSPFCSPWSKFELGDGYAARSFTEAAHRILQFA